MLLVGPCWEYCGHETGESNFDQSERSQGGQPSDEKLETMSHGEEMKELAIFTQREK